MNAVAGVVAIVAVLVTLAATVAVYPAIWRAFRQQWRPIPPERRRWAWFGFGLMAVALVVVAVLLILEPFGSDTVVWVLLVGGGAVMLICLAATVAQAVIDVRRARRHRTDGHRSETR